MDKEETSILVEHLAFHSKDYTRKTKKISSFKVCFQKNQSKDVASASKWNLLMY